MTKTGIAEEMAAYCEAFLYQEMKLNRSKKVTAAIVRHQKILNENQNQNYNDKMKDTNKKKKSESKVKRG